MNLKCYFFFFVLFILSFLVAGCRSSQSGSLHTEINTQYLKEKRSDSTGLKEKLVSKLAEQDAKLRMRVIEFYPLEPDDTSQCGSVKSIVDLDFTSTSKSDSTVEERQLTCRFDTASEQSMRVEKEDGTYDIKQMPWYQPFIPYLVFAFIIAVIYYFRRR